MKMKKIDMRCIFLIMSAVIFVFSINTYAQREKVKDHHDNGKHKGWYKHEDEHRDQGRYERGDRHGDNDEHHDESYRRIRYRDRDYYFHGREFYERRRDGYVVARPPIGFRIDFLPEGYRVVRYRRIRYYVVGGMYFRFMPSTGVYISVKAPFY